MNNVLIYGATGYQGELLAREAVRRGLSPIIAGRDAGKVKQLADELGVEGRVFDLTDSEVIGERLLGISVVLNAAGPFAITAPPLLRSAMEMRVHYLDTTAELGTFLESEAADAAAKKAGVMVMSGTGWDVVPSDTLAVRTAARVADPVSLLLALKIYVGTPGERVPLLFSQGSITSAAGFADYVGSVRVDGILTKSTDAGAQSVDFGYGPEEVLPAPMGDLVTGFKSTRIPNISVHIAGGIPSATAREGHETLAGPDAEDRAIGRARVFSRVIGRDGSIAEGIVDTPTGYGFTQIAAVEIVSRILAGEFTVGFQSPASAYGSELLTSIGDSYFIDV